MRLLIIIHLTQYEDKEDYLMRPCILIQNRIARSLPIQQH